MTALTKERDTPRRDFHKDQLGLAAGAKVFAGSIVCRSATGWATKGAVATTLKALGVATHTADNTSGNNGDVNAGYRRDGLFRFGNSASTDQITAADLGNSCYIVDDQTVAKTDGSSTRSVAGVIRAVDAVGVWISFA